LGAPFSVEAMIRFQALGDDALDLEELRLVFAHEFLSRARFT